MTAPSKPEFLSALLMPFSEVPRLREEKARLEAFLAAVPGAYCGFCADGSVVYSEAFCAMLGLEAVTSVHDIQACLETSDAAALEGLFFRLEEDGEAFSLTAAAAEKVFRISGSQGAALDGGDRFTILWLEDVTAEQGERQALSAHCDKAEREQERLQNALDAVPAPLWIRDADGVIVLRNQAYVNLAGEKELSLSAKSKSISLKDMARKAAAEGRAQSAESHIIAGGARRRVRLEVMPLSQPGQTLGMALDVTREEELDAELRRDRAANKILLEHLRTAIGIYGADQRLEFYNSAFTQLWGLDAEWLDGGPGLADVLEKLRETRRLPEQADFRKYKQSWLDMFTGLIDPHEDMLHLPDGTALRRLVVPHPMGGLMMIFEDVTSRLEMESSYNTLIAVQKETLDNLAEGVAVYGGDGRLKLWNPAFAALWKLNPEDMEGQPHITMLAGRMGALFDDAEQETARRLLKVQALDPDAPDGRMVRADGVLVDCATVPLPDGGILVSHADVTDSAQVETALREKNAALETAERLKVDFLANVSYQLRTPLSSIMGFAEILDKAYFGELNARQKEYASGIHEAGERLLELINDILDLSTIEAGYMELMPEPFDIYQMLDGVYALSQDWAGKRKIHMKFDCLKDVGTVTADRRRIKQVVLNLVRNAIAFTPEDGTITLSAQREGGNVALSVADTGIGIAKQDQERIFEAFERGATKPKEDGAPPSARGAGLGLSLVRSIVEMHGGRVVLESAEGQGTTVTVFLPV